MESLIGRQAPSSLMQAKLVLVSLLVLTVPLTGCLGDEEAETQAGTPTAPDVPIPDLTAPNQYGENITVSNMEGTMLVLLLNAGGWCPPCESSAENSTALIQEMETIDDRYNVSFIEVLHSNDDGETANQTYALNWSLEHNTSHHILHSQLAKDYAEANLAEGFPTYIIVDLDGLQRLKVAYMNGITAEDVQDQYEIYLAEKGDDSSAS